MTGWLRACAVDDIEPEDVLRFDHAGSIYAIYRAPDGRFYATEGLCTHGRAQLSEGFVMEHVIECPKHNGRFDYRTGAAQGAPACVDLKIYKVRVDGADVLIEIGEN